ncbi:hypothetical protein [Herbaspirillum frisingense]|uniref:Transposase n=1 Tax=Herbaspirillum frisingense TaxID=92645 RepID=A0ABU1PJN6_9BURK|nr:hypothetical protein [Herbaspirillum frisingense]MDR6585677.1 hypothetical protein [Herbaspirillum frisingense]
MFNKLIAQLQIRMDTGWATTDFFGEAGRIAREHDEGRRRKVTSHGPS